MKNNNKGFIAISLIYSFFLVFLITLLSIVTSYAQNRILLKNIKEETQKYLDGLAQFNPVNALENREYTKGELITFGNETWQVLEDGQNEENEYVLLLLNRDFTEEEIKIMVDQLELTDATEENKVRMCLNSYHASVCNYKDAYTYNGYTWQTSIVRRIIEDWFNKNAVFQKGVATGNIMLMNSIETEENASFYSSYIRIPTENEYALIDDTVKDTIWYLTAGTIENGQSNIQVGNEKSVLAHDTLRTIRPVIQVKKRTS